MPPVVHSQHFSSVSPARASTTIVHSTSHYYPPPPPSLGSSLAGVHLHMHPAPISFLPAYHYEPGLGLTLYHHNHYTHYSVLDMIIRAILILVLTTICICMLCYIIGVCCKSKEQEQREEREAYQRELDNESVIVEEKVEVIHHADGGITENRTVATTRYDYEVCDHGSDAFREQQQQQ